VSDDVQIYNQDCIPGMQEKLRPESVHLCVSSIPFGALFMYSGKKEDIGNNVDGVDMRAGQFGLHMRFFIEQLERVMKRGCNVAIHIQQLLRYKNQHGYMGRRDFRGACVDLFEAGGFEYTGEFVIPKNPQVIAQRLSLHSLQFQTGRTNARKLMPAVNDYVLVFQKPGESDVPVRALRHEENPKGWLSSEDWIRDAHGVWDDIQEIDVLEGYRSARESEEEKHVCPLQLSVIKRCVQLWTNPGELVLDPFMGIGSTAWVCRCGKTGDGKLHAPRRVVGFELKESYHAKALNYLKDLAAIQAEEAKDLFTEVKA
jgi:DNA modification methylase